MYCGNDITMIRVKMTNKKTKEVSNLFFETYEQMTEVVDLMSKTNNYEFCLYGSYDLHITGC